MRLWLPSLARSLSNIRRERADNPQASVVSFIVGFSEVTRRGIWIIFRLENEQAANIERRRAVRDMRVPYTFAAGPLQLDGTSAMDPTPSIESQAPSTPGAASTLSRIGTRMRTAHVRDYQRRPDDDNKGDDGDDDDDDE